MKVIVQGVGAVMLSDATDLKDMLEGGEGMIYVRGTTLYKIWLNPAELVKKKVAEKMSELQVLAEEPDIIIPQHLVLDARGKPIGLTMRYVPDTYVLAQTFPKAFRTRVGMTPDKALERVRRLQRLMAFTHSKGCLIVDLNEMNFLESHDFSRMYAIDTTTYKTRSFPPTALMESVRDRHGKGFSEQTDYFSFAVVSFQMFVGMHPYRGTYHEIDAAFHKDDRLDQRMLRNISVFHPGVGRSGGCLPLEVIPDVYRGWYEAVFEHGRRDAPPSDLHAVAIIAPVRYGIRGDSRFNLDLYATFDGDLVSFYKDVALTARSLYVNGRVAAPARPNAHVAITPHLSHAVQGYIEGGALKLYDATAHEELAAPPVRADALTSYEGRLMLKSGDSLLAVAFIERGGRLVPATEVLSQVMPQSTRLFDGVAIEVMLKSYYAVMSPDPGTARIARLKELEGYKIIDAKFSRRVLMVVGQKGGRYDKLIFKFADDYSAHRLRTLTDVTSTAINFVVRDDGLCLHMHEDELEVFKSRMDDDHLVSVADPVVNGNVRLFYQGTQSMFAVGDKLYKFAAKHQA